MVQNQRDPWRTASILLAFITEYNIALAVVHIVTCLIIGDSINPIDRVWDFREAQFGQISGYRTCFTFLTTACLMVPVEVLQIARAKLVLDFAMTAQLSHLLLTWLYSGRLPFTWSWWMTWLISSCIMVFGGEYACMQIELQPIYFGTGHSSTNGQSSNTRNNQMSRQSTSNQPERLSNASKRDGNEDIELQERDTLMEQGQSSRLKP